MNWIEFDGKFLCLDNVVSFETERYGEVHPDGTMLWSVRAYIPISYPASRYEGTDCQQGFVCLGNAFTNKQAGDRIIRDIILGKYDVTDSVMSRVNQEV